MKTESTTFTCDRCGLREEFKGIGYDPRSIEECTIKPVAICIPIMHGLNESFQWDLCLPCRQSLAGAVNAWEKKSGPNQGDEK